MGADCFCIEYEFKDNANKSWNEKEFELLGYDLYDVLYEFLSNTLTRKAEADYLIEIDDGYMPVANKLYIEKDELVFCVHDYTPIFSRVAFHWFEIASIICRQQEIKKLLARYI